MKGNIFLPVQALNELRREGFEKLTEHILAKWERKTKAEDAEKEVRMPDSQLLKWITNQLFLLHPWKKNVSWNRHYPVMR